MKKIIVVIALASISLVSEAQNFNAGGMSADVQTGIDVYDTEYTTHYTFNNFDTTIVDTDKAAAKNISLGFEYEVIKRLGVGVRAKFNNYFVDKDSVNNTRPTCKSQDYMLTANYHVIDKEKFDLSGGVSIGGSHLRYDTKNTSKDVITGSGLYIQFQVNPRFIISKKVGLGMSIYSPIVNYSKMTTTNSNVNKYALTKWKGSGYGFSFGISYLIVTK